MMNDALTFRTPALIAGLLLGTGLVASTLTMPSPASASGRVAEDADAALPAEPVDLEPEPEAPAAAAASTCDPALAVYNAGCEIDMTHPTNPLWPCAIPGIAVESWNGSGLTISVDMSDPGGMSPTGQWDIMEVVGMTSGLSGYALNIGNSPSNNGWTGDAGDNSNDAEAQITGNTLRVYHGDRAGSGLALQVGNAVSTSGGFFEATVCDGTFIWESDTTAPTLVTHPDSIFQHDGSEPDVEAGGTNDQMLYIGFNQVVDGPYRSGSGIDPFPYLILSAL